jgi:long-chain acyl-CoA synthetase
MTAAPRSGSVGLPLAGVEIRIEPADDALAHELDDDSLASLEADADPGPISVRGPQLFSGYWPDGADGPDAGGWFTTSDLGYIDSRGELHLIDRQAETIAITGFTVYPREVESALISHPFVRDAAVIGLPGRSGAELAAAVVPVHGTTPTADDLTEHLGELLPAFKRPVHYRIVPILPRTELGRLDRDAVRADWADADGIELAENSGGARLSVVADSTGSAKTAPKAADRAASGRADAASDAKAEPTSPEVPMTTPAPTPAPAEPPEVIEVSQLDQLGSRLPGVSGRSRRSAEDTDSDLFGEEIFDPEPREADTE